MTAGRFARRLIWLFIGLSAYVLELEQLEAERLDLPATPRASNRLPI